MIKRGFSISLNANRETIFQVASENGLVQFVEDKQLKITIILNGRIYYKQDLITRFPELLTFKDSSQATLILNLFKQQGITGLQALEGEFSLVICDANQNRLFGLRDPLGCYPIYWTFDDEIIYISSNLRFLAQQTKVAINLEHLTSFLMFPYAFTELTTEETAYENIYRVLPGNLITINTDKSVKKLYAWNWLEKFNSPENITAKEAGEQFRAIFTQAIQERLNFGKSASHLSGGMDSSSVVCLGKNLLPQDKLTTISLVYELRSLCKETDYINYVLEQDGNIEPYFIKADHYLDFQWSKIPEHDEPYAGLFHLGMETAIIELASSLKITTILTGSGAELIAEGNRYHLADLVYQGKLSQALSLARQWATAKNQSLWSILSEYALTPLIPPFLKEGIPTLLRQGYGTWPKLAQFSIPPWIKPVFAHKYRMQQKSWTILNRTSTYPIEQSHNLLGLQAIAGNWTAWYLAAPVNIHISQPFLDPRLIVYSLSLPREIREIPGLPKPLLQEAMRGILPEPIRKRRYKGNFNEVYWKGFAQNLPTLEAMVENSQIADLDIFNKSQLIEAMREHAIGIGDIPSGGRISSLLSVIAWFNQG